MAKQQSAGRLVARKLQKEDLGACFRLDPPRFGEERIGFRRALGVWKGLVGTCAFDGSVIELLGPPGDPRMVAFGMRIFVSREFVEGELENPRAGLVSRLTTAVEAGQPVLLGEAQIGHANRYHGLDVVTLAAFRYSILTPDLYEVAAAVMAARFIEVHAGYWFRQLILEAVGEEDKKHTDETRIFRIVRNFESLEGPPRGGHTAEGGALATITRQDTLRVLAHPLTQLFVPKKPQLRLRSADQHFLSVASDGLTDDELARALKVSVSGVKKRWLNLFQRITDIHPAFFPGDAKREDVRGRQKRHLLVSYIRSHPEELTPFKS